MWLACAPVIIKEMSDIVREILDTYRVIAELPCATWKPRIGP